MDIVDCVKRHPDLCKISMIGHNIGGLYCRYAAGAMFANDMFKMVKPVNFITLGTPHLGSGGTLLSDDMANLLLGETGHQLGLRDYGVGKGVEPMMMKICHRQVSGRRSGGRRSGEKRVDITPTAAAHDWLSGRCSSRPRFAPPVLSLTSFASSFSRPFCSSLTGWLTQTLGTMDGWICAAGAYERLISTKTLVKPI